MSLENLYFYNYIKCFEFELQLNERYYEKLTLSLNLYHKIFNFSFKPKNVIQTT